MKTFTLTIVLVFVATLSFAQFPQSCSPESAASYFEQDLRATIYQGQPSMIHVKMAKELGEKVKVRVVDHKKVLHVRNCKRFALVDIKYDLKEFPEGEYTIEILQDKEVVFSQVVEKKINNEVLSMR